MMTCKDDDGHIVRERRCVRLPVSCSQGIPRRLRYVDIGEAFIDDLVEVSKMMHATFPECAKLSQEEDVRIDSSDTCRDSSMSSSSTPSNS